MQTFIPFPLLEVSVWKTLRRGNKFDLGSTNQPVQSIRFKLHIKSVCVCVCVNLLLKLSYIVFSVCSIFSWFLLIKLFKFIKRKPVLSSPYQRFTGILWIWVIVCTPPNCIITPTYIELCIKPSVLIEVITRYASGCQVTYAWSPTWGNLIWFSPRHSGSTADFFKDRGH